MWTKSGMSVGESFTVSGMGLCVVFLTLVVLALAILIFSKIFKAAGIGTKKTKTGPDPEKAAAEEKNDDGVMAILIAVVSEAVGEPVESFKITDIREIKEGAGK